MDAAEVEEEMMALESIFYDSFTKIEHNRFRIRIESSVATEEGADVVGATHHNAAPPFFIEIALPSSYPHHIPSFDISNINNNPYPEFAKQAILRGLQEQASTLIGESMCYSILEWLKDKLPEFYSMKPAFVDEDTQESTAGQAQSDPKDSNFGKKDGKGKMTKAQKRRYFDRFGAAAEKPRGWDWVSIISHLSQVPPHGPQS